MAILSLDQDARRRQPYVVCPQSDTLDANYNLGALNDNQEVVCALCGERRARRACPALDRWICPVCCGTKRLVQISCPRDCAYLTSAREHPPAVEVRRQQRDFEHLVQYVRDLSERQSQVFFLVTSFLNQYRPAELHALVDDDVAEATGAVASTLETATRGVIYDHRPASLPAERLATALKALLSEAGKDAGTAFERDAAVVLRRLEEAARSARGDDPDGTRTFLDRLARVVRRPEQAPAAADTAGSSLIVP
jgi:hypothetical protein